ncbi:hypothetical protein LTR56_005413 [Elasticomyces elasticus]|uniref:Uncharacterized protein n=1 Tax=Elasticomyces elasticus TaxID=574655 RepID=A0AAN7VZ76_9PEZI|nr:hypothetical protein LTR22_020644 [Elasticomyces elasticus]KAK3651904.1 hypothetical protein LTR56_005413 [Elasticomyces elasticus]KAK4927799.1 hypothetical protein LTR49_005425 [Elasticomyces elasticus]KAK5690574.1 hypothetical protein LTR97_012127 [Elasticomyces elasticus]KAK5761470.1 hypothetical protein LTS12_008433 [Elasticomyces elasticus]
MNDTRDNSKNDSMEAKKLRRAKSVKKAKVAQMAKKKARPAATNRLENYYCTWKTTEEVASPELGTVDLDGPRLNSAMFELQTELDVLEE